ncbi:TlpA family protein disulfide reductase [Alistipes sp. OttesenSCG-928-B03]|nr:TlpA family protein disulfide reductase [Alistipes sp. OttesenSCG-928-B03]
MKKIAICFLTALSCGAAFGAAPGRIIVAGATPDVVIYNSDRGDGTQIYAPVIESGVSMFEISEEDCRDLVYLIDNNHTSWVRVLPGETVNIDVSRTPWVFSGDQARVNGYLYDWTHKMYFGRPNMLASNVQMMMIQLPESRTLSDLSPLHEPGYTEWLYGLGDECLRDLEKAALDDADFVVRHRSRINSAWIEMMVSNYCIAKQMRNPVELPHPVTEITLSDPLMLTYPGLDYIFSYYITVCEDAGLIEYDSYANFICKRAERVTDPALRTNYLAKETESLIVRRRDLYQADLILECVREMMEDPSGRMFIDDLLTFYTNIKEAGRIPEGRPGFAFEFEDRNGNLVRKEDFSGKYLYIDVWATWCGPCKEQIPYLVGLEKELKGKNIEFISISVDKPSDREKWVAMLDELGLHGHQVITPDGFKNEMCKHYKITGIPHFLLYGPDGTVVMANARRPSDPLLRLQLDELLRD